MLPNLTARRSCAIAVVLLALSVPAGVAAQRLAPDFASAPVTLELSSPGAPVAAAVAFGHPDDYRWEGALAGAVGLGLLTAAAAREFCGYGEAYPPPNCTVATIGGLLIGATVGVTVGGIVGGAFKKPQT